LRRSWSVIGLTWAAALLAPAFAQALPQEKIVFASDRDGTADIWEMNPDGSGQAKIGGSPTADDSAPAVSPDGSAIAFVRNAEPFPWGRNGDIWVMRFDGTGEKLLAMYGADPAWSPDGKQITFGVEGNSERPNGIWKMNADGTGQTVVTNVDRDHYGPSWSPDGQKIAFHTAASYSGENIISLVNADGRNPVKLTDRLDTAEDNDPDWSPDGSAIAFSRLPWCCQRPSIFKMNADGGGEMQVTSSDPDLADEAPSWSPDGQKIAFTRRSCCTANHEIWTMNPDGTGQTRLTNNSVADTRPDWAVLQVPGYPRPKGATPLRSSLVIAYKPCTSPNRTHGAPLVADSCHPPQPFSDQLTVGTLDSNGQPARFTGFVRADLRYCRPCANALPEDVRIAAMLEDVRNRSDLSDYTGELHGAVTVRITDRYNGKALDEPATTVDSQLSFPVPCTPTDDTTTGSTCSAFTSLNSILPGVVQQEGRAIWEFRRIDVLDGGADGVAGTISDNTLFATEGIFVP
jgi:hypothetical protein